MILITGATGKVGSEAARLLAARHQPTRALVGDPSRAPDGDVEIATGDFDRPDTLDAAMRGIDTVLLVSPAVPAQEIAVIDSAVRQGATRVIKVTSKASADSPVDRRRGQAQIEAHLEATGLAYTLLRANAYMQNLLALAPMIKQTGGFLMSAGDGAFRSALEWTRQLVALTWDEPPRSTLPVEAMLSTQSGSFCSGTAVACTLNCQPPAGRMFQKNEGR